MSSRGERLAGALAILFYGIHGTYHALHGFPQNLLWFCHLGAFLAGCGLLLRSPRVNAIGAFWLFIGTPLWAIGLAMGGTFTPTSVLTHVGGLTIGLWGIRRLGLPRGVWWMATAGMVVLHGATRPLNPAGKNVNFAGGIWTGLEGWFSSHAMFLAAALVVVAATLFLLERGLGRLFGRDAT